MGLMDIGQNNPYARINPFAAVISEGLKGYQTESARIEEEARNKIAQQQQAMLMKMKQDEADRIAEQAVREQQARGLLEDRVLGQKLTQQAVSPSLNTGMSMASPVIGRDVPLVDVANRLTPRPVTQQELLNFSLANSGTQAGKDALEQAKMMIKDKTPQQAWAEKVLGSPKDFDDKSISLANMIMGVDGGGVIRTEKPAYKQRQYEKGNEIIHEYSNDDGKSWLLLSKAPRYKPDSGAAGLRLDDSNRKFAASLRKEFNNLPDVKETNEALPKINSMRKAMEEAKTTNNYVAVDQALISLYNKLTDPTSVVRESEYARTAENLPVLNAIKGKMQKVVKGGAGLTSSDRAALMQMAELMNKGYQDIRNRRVQEYSGYATSGGVDPSHVINDSFRNTLSASSAPTSVPQGAIDQLKANPKLAVYFDQKYGKGASKQYLGR